VAVSFATKTLYFLLYKKRSVVMRIISDITGKEYKTVDECLKAEEQYKLQKEAEAKAKAEHEKALDEAYKKAMAACDEYLRLAGIEYESTDHGYKIHYHGDNKADQIFEDILNAWLS
jgi:uncharacterized protein YgiB involved in biofilm formation